MRRVAVVIAVALAITVLLPSVAEAKNGAQSLPVATFLQRCTIYNYTITEDTVIQGSGQLGPEAGCLARLAAGVSLTFRDANIAWDGTTNDGGGTAFFGIGGAAGSQLRVERSRIEVDNGVFLTLGSDAGTDGTRVEVSDSTLSSNIDTVALSASREGNGGTVVVRHSNLSAPLGVSVLASCASEYFCSDETGTSTGGTAVVEGNVIEGVVDDGYTYGDWLVVTGTSGRTVAKHNSVTVMRTRTLSTGEGGTCMSKHNTPDVGCVPPAPPPPPPPPCDIECG